MFEEIEQAIIEALKLHINIPKDRISVNNPQDKKDLPAITVEDTDYIVSEVGIGKSIYGEEAQIIDKFSGDDENTEFELSEKPLRPIQRVEYPTGKTIGSNQYLVDYQLNKIIFHSPPKKGDDNISVRYIKPVVSLGLKFELKYHIRILILRIFLLSSNYN